MEFEFKRVLKREIVRQTSLNATTPLVLVCEKTTRGDELTYPNHHHRDVSDETMQ